MSTIANLEFDLRVAIDALVVPSIIQYSNNPFRSPPVEPVPPGDTLLRIAVVPAPLDLSLQNSNDVLQAVSVAINLHHHLEITTQPPGSDVEREYMIGAMATHMHNLVDPAWWRAIASVHEIDFDSLSIVPPDSIEPEGNELSYGVTINLILNPT